MSGRGSKMKKYIPVLMGLLLGTYHTKASRTFFSIPVPFHPVSVERITMTHDQMFDYTKATWRNFSITLFGGESTQPDRLAQYFLPFNKTCLVAGGLGSEAVKNHNVDLISNYFDVLTGLPRSDAEALESDDIFDIINTWTFQSNLRFCPSHKYWGIGLLYHQHLSSELDKGWWFEFAMPIMGIKNDMGMCETIVTPGGPNGDDPQASGSFFTDSENIHAAQNMTSALRSGILKYGRIDEREYRRTKWGVADIEARLGYTYFRGPRYHLSSYAGILAPTGTKVTSEYLFEKIIGYNGHTGFFFGTVGGIKVWAHDENSLAFEFDTGATLFLDNVQIRSIDPYGKPWGRYIWVYPSKRDSAQLSPGINYFTKAVRVDHGSIRALNLSWVYTMSNFQGELGYHFYSRDREKVRLARSWHNDYRGFAGIWNNLNNFIKGGDPRITKSSATINNYTEVTNDVVEFKASPVEDTFVPIDSCQLDFESAEHPSVVVSTVYLSLVYGWHDIVFPTTINLAGGYEFGDGPAVMDKWKVWAKIGVAF